MNFSELMNLDDSALNKEIFELKKELFNLNMNRSSMHIKDYSQLKKLRIRIAQAKTLLAQRAAANATQ
jgi:large subunit ribosomal protein L29